LNCSTSSPERETFHQADMLFEGLPNLSQAAVLVVRGAASAGPPCAEEPSATSQKYGAGKFGYHGYSGVEQE
jgi:hypothetical protein